MKNKNLKTALSVIMMIGIVTALIMMMLDMCDPSEGGWFYEQTEGGDATGIWAKLSFDWNFAAIYLTMLLVAFVAWLTKFCIFCVPALRDGDENAKTYLICNIFIALGLILAIVAFFLPVHEWTFETEEEAKAFDAWKEGRIVAGTVLSWIGTPMALVAGVSKTVLALKK